MCTVTILCEPNRLLLTMSRDEQKSRGREIPPAPNQSRWLAPRDGDRGGTWIAVNQWGLAATLLNLYSPQEQPVGAASRGEIIPRLVSQCGSVEEAAKMLDSGFDPLLYSPFSLILVEIAGPARLIQWSGELLRSETLPRQTWTLVTSSSWRQPEVRRWRQRRFQKWLESEKLFHGKLPSFHLLQPPGWEKWAPLMERPQVHTRSITQVEINRGTGAAVMRYWPSPPSQASQEYQLSLSPALRQ